MSSPAVSPEAGPMNTPTTTTALIVRTAKSSPDGNMNALSVLALDARLALGFDRLGDLLGRRLGRRRSCG